MRSYISTPEQFLQIVDSIPDNDISLSAFTARRKAYEIREGLIDPQDAVRWHNSIIRQHEFSGQIIDFTNPKASGLDNDPIFKCPICGRLGKVYEDPEYPFYTEHIIYIRSGFAHSSLDECRWGKKWLGLEEEYYEEGVNIRTEFKSDDMFSPNNRTVTRKKEINFTNEDYDESR